MRHTSIINPSLHIQLEKFKRQRSPSLHFAKEGNLNMRNDLVVFLQILTKFLKHGDTFPPFNGSHISSYRTHLYMSCTVIMLGGLYLFLHTSVILIVGIQL